MITVKSIEVRDNFKNFCDRVFKGETIIISRKKNENVVMMSKKEYNILQKAKRNEKYLTMINKSIAEAESGNIIIKSMDELEKMQGNNLKIHREKKSEVNIMLMTEFNQEVFERVIREKAEEKGIEKGENRVNQLNSRLISENRFDDLIRSVKDKQYQQELYKEFGL